MAAWGQAVVPHRRSSRCAQKSSGKHGPQGRSSFETIRDVCDLLRRECLDHMIVLNEDNLRRILSDFFAYYHEARAPLSPNRNLPIPRSVCPTEEGQVVARPTSVACITAVTINTRSCGRRVARAKSHGSPRRMGSRDGQGTLTRVRRHPIVVRADEDCSSKQGLHCPGFGGPSAAGAGR